jgi:hypothetical protein
VRNTKQIEKLRRWAQGECKTVDPVPPVTIHAADPVNDRFDSACAGKEKFPNKDAAYSAQLYRQRQGVGHEGMHAYRCAYCGSWHLGHSRVKQPSSPKR